ncbi:MAG TPA: DNA polymerase III subunit delta [Tepidisphaeraceae bacterium]|nr:DNA polymerase III subunit delta [Tepidisphaeraceae bacterium]
MVKPVYALVGSDAFLQLQEMGRIFAIVGKDAQRSDFDGESAQLADVLDELRSFAMFGGGGKLVVIRNADAFITRFRSQLEDYLAEPSSAGVMVLRLNSLPKTQRVYKLIDKVGQIVDCEPPGEPSKWAIEHAKSAHKVTLAPDAARLLSELIGNDLGRLDTEIAKLALFADTSGGGGGKITADVVTGNVAFTREREMWDLTNAMAGGNTTEALRRWRQLVQSDPSAEFRAVTWLGIWLGEVGLVVSKSPAANKLRWKYKGDAFDKFVAGANALGKDGYARALDLLTEIDKQSKSGVGDAAENVERFILALAPASAR